jgi:PEP-CTERM motif
MKTKLKFFLLVNFAFAAVLQAFCQGYIVPNGVVDNLFPGEIDVWNPGTQITGFILTPAGPSQPDVFHFDEPLTVGVRVFLVSLNQPVSLNAILAQSYPELSFPADYTFDSGSPFYVGLYTGADFAPPYPPYPPYYYADPVFGWAKLVNNDGVIELLDGAVAYQAAGILAGTQTIIPVPEPSAFALVGLGALVFAIRCRR